MWRNSTLAACLICVFPCGFVEAQHHHPEGRRHTSQQQTHPFLAPPNFSFYGMYGHHHAYRMGGPIIYQPFIPQPVQLVSYTYPVSTVPVPNFFPFDVTKPAVVTQPTSTASSPAARLKSIELQTRGDQRMREMRWPEARLAYTNSVSAAPERATAHLRLALSFVVTQRFDAAIRQIRRALALDHRLPSTADKLEAVFGPDSKAIRLSIVSKLETWVREEPTNSDRLFLYGVVLHLNSDPRAKETLQSALHVKTATDTSPIAMFLENIQNDQEQKGFPKLNNRPDPVLVAQPHFDLRFPKGPVPNPVPMPDAPVPMPDGPVPMP